MKNDKPCCGEGLRCFNTCPANFRNVKDKKLRKQLQDERKNATIKNQLICHMNQLPPKQNQNQ
jgi:hypothetical protein